MNNEGRGILADWDSDDETVADVMGDAIADALEKHKKAGVPIAVWDWDRQCVVIIPPEEIVIPDRHFHDDPIEVGREAS